MKYFLVAVMIFGLMGCTSPEVLDDEPFYTPQMLDTLHSRAAQVFEYKDGYLMHVQLGSDEGLDFIQNLKMCSNVGAALHKEGHSGLAEVFSCLGLAGDYFDMWIDTGDAIYYTKGTRYYSEAETLYSALRD